MLFGLPRWLSGKKQQQQKNWSALQEMQVQFVGWEVPLEKKMTTHCSILAWEIPWTRRSLAGASPEEGKEMLELRSWSWLRAVSTAQLWFGGSRSTISPIN